MFCIKQTLRDAADHRENNEYDKVDDVQKCYLEHHFCATNIS